MADVGDILGGVYELTERAPARDGETSEAFAGTDSRSGSAVLVEILREGVSSVEKARFGLRGRRLQALRHASLLATLEATPAYAVLEPLPPETLAGHAGLAVARARQKLAFVAQVASALALLHKNGIIHGGPSLEAIGLAPDGRAKLLMKIGVDVGASPLDDVRAFAVSACELVVGSAAVGEVEATVADRLHDAGFPKEAAMIIARIQAGASMTSEDLAQKLGPFAEYAGPGTEPLLPVARKSYP